MANKSKKTQAIGKWMRRSRTGNQHSRFILSIFSLWLLCGQAHAIGLGEIDVQSSIGQPIRATVALHGNDLHALGEHCVKGTLSLLDNSVRSSLRVGLKQSGNAMILSLSGSRGVDEPAAVVTVETQCGSRVVREYTVLLEPATDPARPAVTALAALGAAASRHEVARIATGDDASQASLQGDAPRAERPIRANRPIRSHRPHRPLSPIPPIEADAPDAQVRAQTRTRVTRAPASVLKLSSAPEFSAVATTESGFLKLKLENMLADPPPVIVANLPVLAETPPTLLPAAYAAPVPAGANDAQPVADLQADPVASPVPTSLTQAGRDSTGSAVGSAFRALSDQIAGVLYFAVIMAGAIWLVLRVRAMSVSTNGRWIPDVAPRESKLTARTARPKRAPASVKAADPAPASTDNIRTWPGNAVNEPAELPAGDPSLRNTLPQAEEIMDVMEQVQFFLSIDDTTNAIRLLEHVIADQGDTPGSPWPWLSLFDVYRKLGEREEYEQLRTRFSQRYNGRVPHWGEPWEETVGLDALPHLKKRITQLWKTDKIVPYLERLLVDNRRGTRQGFDLSSFQDIRMLLEIAYTTHESKKYLKPALRTPQWSVAA